MSPMEGEIPAASSKARATSGTDHDGPVRLDLSILIVNWNSADYLKSCLTSVFREVHNITFEVMVIDNASYDGSAELIKREFPQVAFIQSHENLGFARANNLGFTYSSGRSILFLNPDTEILKGSINTMYAALESSQLIGIVACKLLNSDLSVQTSSVQLFPTILNQFTDSNWLKHLLPRSKICGVAPLFTEASGSLADVEVVPGTCLMIKRDVFETVGLFCSEYFMYAEDLDLCHKVWNAGYSVCYTNDAVVVHHGGQSSKHRTEDGFADLAKRGSTLTFLRKTRGPAYVRWYRGTLILASVARLSILGVLLAISPGRVKVSLRCSVTKWRRILAWSVGLQDSLAKRDTENCATPGRLVTAAPPSVRRERDSA
jgi:N-acetylglucosaminyl-diphospho-decaprenol L-rhamnosyltransferase